MLTRARTTRQQHDRDCPRCATPSSRLSGRSKMRSSTTGVSGVWTAFIATPARRMTRRQDVHRWSPDRQETRPRSRRRSRPSAPRAVSRTVVERSPTVVRAVAMVSRPVSGILWAACLRLDARWPSICAAYPRVARRLASSGGRAVRALCSALLRVGFTEPPGSPRTLVRSYRTVSPLPVTGRPAHRRSALCCTCPSGHPDLALASTLPGGVPTFLDTDAVSDAVPRPPGRLTIARVSVRLAADPGRISSSGRCRRTCWRPVSGG